MATADEQIRVSERVKRILDRRRRDGESYNDVLERIFEEETDANFDDGFGILSAETADRVRDQRERAKMGRKERMRRLEEDT